MLGTGHTPKNKGSSSTNGMNGNKLIRNSCTPQKEHHHPRHLCANVQKKNQGEKETNTPRLNGSGDRNPYNRIGFIYISLSLNHPPPEWDSLHSFCHCRPAHVGYLVDNNLFSFFCSFFFFSRKDLTSSCKYSFFISIWVAWAPFSLSYICSFNPHTRRITYSFGSIPTVTLSVTVTAYTNASLYRFLALCPTGQLCARGPRQLPPPSS